MLSFKTQKHPVCLSVCWLIVLGFLGVWHVQAKVCEIPRVSVGLHRVVLRDLVVPVEIPSAIHYVHDLNGTLTWGEIQQLKLDAPQWRINEKLTNTFDHGTYWFVFSVQNQSGLDSRWVLESDNSALAQVDTYIRPVTEKYMHWQSGYQRPMKGRAIWHRDHLFPLILAPCETVQIYIRVQDDFSVKLPLMIWEKSAYQQKNQLMTLFWACCLGILGVMLIQHLLMFSVHSDVSYLYYSGFIGAVMLFVFTHEGLTYQLLWPGYSAFHAEIISGSVLFVTVFFVMFTIELLSLKEKNPFYRYLLLGFVVCNAVLFTAQFGFFKGLVDYQKIRDTCNLLLVLSMLSIGLYCWRNGDPVARNYVVALSVLFVHIAVTNVHFLGVIPSSFMTKNSISIGFIIEAILQPLVLSSRFNELRAKRFYAQASAHAKSHFLSNMSREVSTPLNAIVGYSSLLKHYSCQDIPNIRVKYLRKTVVACDSLLVLVNDILKLSKMGKDISVKLDNVEFDVHIFFAELSDMFAGIDLQKPVDIVFSVDNTVPRILIGDRTRLSQMLTSRINSAIAHTHRGEILVCLKRSSSLVLDYKSDSGESIGLTFSVRDTGNGMPKATYVDLVKQLEEGGFDTRQTSIKLGQGLRICNQLARLMGGRLYLDVDGELGCTCYFDLYFDLPHITATPTLAETLALPELWVERSRVLLIGGTSALGDFLTRAYMTMGLTENQVSYNRSIEDGLSLLTEAYRQGKPYNLVMLDVTQDFATTALTLKRLQQVDIQATITLLLVLPSGYTAALECSQLHGVARVLHKPLNVFDLHDVVLECLSAKYAEAANHAGAVTKSAIKGVDSSDLTMKRPVGDEVLLFELPDKVPGIQLAMALVLMRGDQRLLLILLNDFINDSADLMTKIYRAQADNDWQQLEYLLHSLKGLALALSADDLVQAASSLEYSVSESGSANFDISLFRAFELALVEALSSARCVVSFMGELGTEASVIPVENGHALNSSV